MNAKISTKSHTNLFVNVVVLVNWLCTQFVRQIFEHILAGSGSNELNIEWLEDWGWLNTLAFTLTRNDHFRYIFCRSAMRLFTFGKRKTFDPDTLSAGWNGLWGRDVGGGGLCFRCYGSRFLLTTSSFLVEIECHSNFAPRLSKKSFFAKLSLPASNVESVWWRQIKKVVRFDLNEKEKKATRYGTLSIQFVY